jgi:urease accessory protein
MANLTLIQTALHGGAYGPHVHIHLPASRATLAKRRWRGVAEDGREFGFDLNETLAHGDHFHNEGDTWWVIEQTAEEVLEIPVKSVEQAARVAWTLGNLHFGIEVIPSAVRVTEDPAVLQLLAREHIHFRRVTCVFQPSSAGAHHHHDQAQDHGHDHGHHHG